MELNVVGGYRLVRCIGEGTRSTIHLAHPVDAGDLTDHGPAVALKIYSEGITPSDIAAELEALGRAAGPHVVAALDVASAGGRPVVIMEKLTSHTLAGLLVARGGLTSGEAVTILAPLAETIERCHRAGVAHGALRPAVVGFTTSGAPTITGFGSATVCEAGLPEARPAEVPLFQLDRDAFARLAEEVLGRVPGSEPMCAWLDAARSSVTWVADLPARLFAWSGAAPVRFTTDPSEHVPAPAQRIEGSEPPLERHPALEALLERVPDQWQVRLRNLGSLGSLGSLSSLRSLGSLVGAVRPKFWLLAGATLVTMVVGAVVLSQPEADAQLPASPTPAASPTPTLALDDALGAGAEDPAVALRALLETREQCIHDLSVLCLDAVAQPGSGALAHDQQLVRELQRGGEMPAMIRPDEIVVEERLGGTALMTVTSANSEPASILVMRSEAGWRIRDYLE